MSGGRRSAGGSGSGWHTATLCWRNCVESANLFETLLPELDEDRFKLWPYTEEARYFWQTKVCQWWGYDALHLGHYEEARRLAERSLALGEQSGIPSLRLDGLISLASVLITTGDCRQAEMHLREYLRISRAHGLKYLVAVAFYHLGLALAGQGAYVRARACLQRSLAWGRESGQLLGGSLQTLGSVELALGNLTQAQTILPASDFAERRIRLFSWLGERPDRSRQGQRWPGAIWSRRAGICCAPSSMLQGSCTLEFVIGAIAAMAELLHAEGQAEAAAELCAALLSWPVTPYCMHDTGQRVRPDLETRLQGTGRAVAAGGLRRGAGTRAAAPDR